MKLMVVGGGGREHAIIKKLKENPEVEVIYALPGNGGIAADAVLDITYSMPADAEGHGALTLKFVTESGYEGSFATLHIEVAPIYLLSADGMTGATQISFRAPAAE